MNQCQMVIKKSLMNSPVFIQTHLHQVNLFPFQRFESLLVFPSQPAINARRLLHDFKLPQYPEMIPRRHLLSSARRLSLRIHQFPKMPSTLRLPAHLIAIRPLPMFQQRILDHHLLLDTTLHLIYLVNTPCLECTLVVAQVPVLQSKLLKILALTIELVRINFIITTLLHQLLKTTTPDFILLPQ